MIFGLINKKSRIAALALVMCFITNIAMAVPPSSSIIVDAESGLVLSSKNADGYNYPASLTKLMTLYMTFEALEKGWVNMDKELPISRSAQNKKPSRLGLRAGDTIRVEDAIYGVITKSANDAATVLAEALGGNEKEFAKMMTKVAHELGMVHTTFTNASGLPDKNQKTTARDMAMLGMAVWHHFPQYYKLFSTRKFTYKGQTFYNHNRMLAWYDGADGMKTGFINASGFNIVTSAKRNGRRLIGVVMGKNSAKDRDRTMAGLLDNGFRKLALSVDNVPMPEEKPVSITMLGEFKAEEARKVADAKENHIGNWSIQVGAFSNYSRARNRAQDIKDDLVKEIGNKDIQVMPYQVANAVVYRSRIMGMDEDTARQACSILDEKDTTCLVIEPQKVSRNSLLAER